MNKTGLLLTLMLLGCGRHHTDPAPVTPAPVAPVAASEAEPQTKVLSVCDQNKAAYLQRTDLTIEPTVNVSIERQFQQVIRLKCDGTVESNKIETVQSPRADVMLHPSIRLHRNATLVKLLGSETCDTKQSQLPLRDIIIFGGLAPITGKTDGTIKVKMDMAEALFTFKATTSLNHIYYSYYDRCESNEFPEACGPKNEIRSGVYNVFVTYNEKTIPGTKTIPAESCHKDK